MPICPLSPPPLGEEVASQHARPSSRVLDEPARHPCTVEIEMCVCVCVCMSDVPFELENKVYCVSVAKTHCRFSW